jgi:hypothetical protein
VETQQLLASSQSTIEIRYPIIENMKVKISKIAYQLACIINVISIHD